LLVRGGLDAGIAASTASCQGDDEYCRAIRRFMNPVRG
jgi:hypothetical protein